MNCSCRNWFWLTTSLGICSTRVQEMQTTLPRLPNLFLQDSWPNTGVCSFQYLGIFARFVFIWPMLPCESLHKNVQDIIVLGTKPKRGRSWVQWARSGNSFRSCSHSYSYWFQISSHRFDSWVRFTASISWFDPLIQYMHSVQWLNSLIGFMDSIRCFGSLVRLIDSIRFVASIHWFYSLMRLLTSITWFDSWTRCWCNHVPNMPNLTCWCSSPYLRTTMLETLCCKAPFLFSIESPKPLFFPCMCYDHLSRYLKNGVDVNTLVKVNANENQH